MKNTEVNGPANVEAPMLGIPLGPPRPGDVSHGRRPDPGVHGPVRRRHAKSTGADPMQGGQLPPELLGRDGGRPPGRHDLHHEPLLVKTENGRHPRPARQCRCPAPGWRSGGCWPPSATAGPPLPPRPRLPRRCRFATTGGRVAREADSVRATQRRHSDHVPAEEPRHRLRGRSGPLAHPLDQPRHRGLHLAEHVLEPGVVAVYGSATSTPSASGSNERSSRTSTSSPSSRSCSSAKCPLSSATSRSADRCSGPTCAAT